MNLCIPYAELEFRLGTYNKAFNPNINKDVFNKIKCYLDKNYQSENFELKDVFYKDVRCTDQVCIQKKKIYNEVIDNPKLDIKLSLSQELPIKCPSTKITFERIKKRHTYKMKDWKIDLTIVNSNKLVTYECELEFSSAYIKIHSLEFLRKHAIYLLNKLISCSNI